MLSTEEMAASDTEEIHHNNVCVDLDAVLAEYDGWEGLHQIGPPIIGARKFLENLRDSGYRIIIFSTRTCCELNRIDHPLITDSDLVDLVEKWCLEWKMPYDEIYIGRGKPLAVAYVDDRAVSCVPHSWEDTRTAFDVAFGQIETLHQKQLAQLEKNRETGN